MPFHKDGAGALNSGAFTVVKHDARYIVVRQPQGGAHADRASAYDYDGVLPAWASLQMC